MDNITAPVTDPGPLSRNGYYHLDDSRTALFDKATDLYPDKEALVEGDKRYTYGRLRRLVDRIAYRFHEEGLRPGDRVLLQLPNQIRNWRSIIWDVIGKSIYQRVQSFSELATALYSFSATRSYGVTPAAALGAKLSPALAGFFRAARTDDEMRNFLIDSIEYLSSFADGNIEVPVSIIRAMNDVERIAQIEESALPPAKQESIRFCTLQIARLAGENG